MKGSSGDILSDSNVAVTALAAPAYPVQNDESSEVRQALKRVANELHWSEEGRGAFGRIILEAQDALDQTGKIGQALGGLAGPAGMMGGALVAAGAAAGGALIALGASSVGVGGTCVGVGGVSVGGLPVGVGSGSVVGAPRLRWTRSIPQIGHFPWVSRTTNGCMPQ